MRHLDFSPQSRVATESEVKEVKSLIKSCILTRKGGMPVQDLRDEYESLTDEEIPYFKLGYSSLFHLLRDIPEVKSDRNEVGAHVLVLKEDQKNKHLINLIKHQKDPKIVRRPSRRSRCESRRQECRQKSQEQYDYNRFYKDEDDRVIEPPIDENFDKPVIYTEYHFEDKISTCAEPVVGKTQLIGDDYFLQLCIKYLNYDLIRKTLKSAITCGTVQSGLTISRAAKRLDNIKSMSNKLVINIGTCDIYNRHTDSDMIDDYLYLLDKLKRKYGYSPSQITLCTLPPMGNVAMFAEPDKYFTHQSFNKWLRNFAEKSGYKLLDFHEEFTDENGVIDYTLFQQDARMVSGTSHPHVLWNYFGRQKSMKMLLNLK